MQTDDTTYLNSLLPFYKQHVEEIILPFWARTLDHQHGGIYTCFTNSGDRLISRDKYIWSQGRYLWAWSKVAAMTAENRLNGDAEALVKHLRKTAHFLENNVFLDNGNCAFLLTETGEKKESTPGAGYDTSIFADCFVCMGLTGFTGLTKDINRFERAVILYRKILERLHSGNYRSEPYPVPPGYRAHSIPMIMLHVSQELVEVAEKMDFSDVESIRQHRISFMMDIMENFYQPDHSIAEFLPEKPAEKDTLLSRHRNPGHAIESMWFVMHAANKTGHSGFIQKAEKAVGKAIESGWDVDFDGLFRFVDHMGGKPAGKKISSPLEEMITDTWDMKLWWPHSEALYATLLGYTLTGNRQMAEMHKKIKNYVFKTFPHPDQTTGEWIQIRNRKGNPVDKIAALPVKDPYHILRSLLLILDLTELKNQTEKQI